MVESGRQGPFELDCQYRCNESDSKLVVKWFFNGESQPFYQWIAELEDPVVTDRYVDVIDMDRSHAAGGAEACNIHTWHLRLVKPTIDMSGKYRCEVLTLANQDSAEASMMVFEPHWPQRLAGPGLGSPVGSPVPARKAVPPKTTL
ncbi:hypothetical protein HPB51_015180 [Rhipicephalus microplus]|uniref:Ig-like domain-containing protein n=1 Tax=Rhipicephalus microplus TaxID=6941 RepID=A0A9J6DNQ0_RHIMP|nr:hypothetical protein HPB51_015180 [Rhipicephalus microplus]